MSLQQITLLDDAQCAELVDRIHGAKEHWVRRLQQPMFTLGTASYLDAAGGRFPSYLEKARRTNPVLRDLFADVYGSMADALEKELGAPVIYNDEHVARPGFHVFLAHPAFTKPVAKVHFDLQYKDIDWTPFGDVDFRQQMSITLAVRLPKQGGGLRLWNLDHETAEKLTADERKALMDDHRKADYVPYEAGKLVVHSGHLLHQIAPAKQMIDDDQRITLQAHALPVDGTWLMYW